MFTLGPVKFHRLIPSVEGNIRDPLDLSSAVNIKSVKFECGMSSFDVDWITVAVESIKSPYVEKMTLCTPHDLMTQENVDTRPPDVAHAQWLALDKALVKYLTSRSFKLKVIAHPGADAAAFEACVERLLPDLFGKRMLEVA